MNMLAMFDENPSMTLQDIKETERYGWTDMRTDKQCENSISTTKFTGGIMKNTTQQPLKCKWTGSIDRNGKMMPKDLVING